MSIAQQTTGSSIYVRFNSDTATRYTWTAFAFDRASTITDYSDGDARCYLIPTSSSYYLKPGMPMQLTFRFSSPYGKSTMVIGRSSSGHEDVSGGNHLAAVAECYYDGVNVPLSSITVGVTAGTFVGKVALLELAQ